ncbi:DNA-binding transcriptional activator of the SARP family [Asanoa hainanensis]|uniref:DNA-binding transcriptional activator of the SARP family n=1 Tax=Asanoa hainanensis TaxID=560556 RepID=A0A239NGX0_9ACTN|nr:BTAD domain-containing putative transcriptional regulator [Asanoa hainanensis]SNT53792.1 DNA-binding transcriptional activator of the SARP family [Asanoa hainanensis]
MVRVRAQLLGQLRVIVDGRLVDTTTSRRSRNVIAYLLAHRDALVPGEVLIDAFWPDAPPRAARNSLHVALSGARRLLRAASPEPIIERRFDAYGIARSVSVWCDVEQFEASCLAGRQADQANDPEAAARHYATAALLFQGDFLADEPYAEWAATRRAELRVRALEARSRLVALYAERGDFGPAATLARQVLTDDPCNEGVHRGLMLCYAGSGLRHLALLQHRQLVGTLWDSLRVGPSSETTALYERLRRPEPVSRSA